MAKKGRPKGRRMITISVAVTQEQQTYLQNQPNASECIRKILDDLIASKQAVEQNMGAITLNNRLENLIVQKNKIMDECHEYTKKHDNCWVHTADESIEWVGEPPDYVAYQAGNAVDTRNPNPVDTEKAKIAWQVVRSYNRALEEIQKQIMEAKQAILALD
jgi:hypothetical protein